MQVAEMTAVGLTAQSVRCADYPEPPAPGPGQVTVEIAAGAINPADILRIEGGYAFSPTVPAVIGNEGAGHIIAIGAGVDDQAVQGLKVGDVVISLGAANWAQRANLRADQVVRLPAGTDLRQAAMLKTNGATALMMLRDYVDLAPGDWVIQNAGNSGVGKNVIRLARAAGYRTINIVRRAELIDELRELGADVVLVDGEDLADRVAEATGGAEIRLALDAVAGRQVIRLGDCLAESGVVVNYGLLSGEACMLNPAQVIFKDISLRGYWRTKAMAGMDYTAIAAIYQELAERVLDGTINVAIEATYPLEKIVEALAHAKREGRGGKILLAPNGDLSE